MSETLGCCIYKATVTLKENILSYTGSALQMVWEISVCLC